MGPVALRLVGVCLDVTERHLAEDRLRLVAGEMATKQRTLSP